MEQGEIDWAKPPLRQKHIWAIRSMLQMDRRTRELAMFNLALDSKLRGCDVVAIKVGDVAPNGYAIDRTTVRQRKTGKPVSFELTEQIRQARHGLHMEPTMAGKWMELIKEVAPRVNGVALLFNPATAPYAQ